MKKTYTVHQVGPDGTEDETPQPFDTKADAAQLIDSVLRSFRICGFKVRGSFSKGYELTTNEMIARRVYVSTN